MSSSLSPVNAIPPGANDCPPCLSYGWFSSVPPPRGPYFWPCAPPDFKLLTPSQVLALVNKTNENEKLISNKEQASEPNEANQAVADNSEQVDLWKHTPPQMVFGWWSSIPPYNNHETSNSIPTTSSSSSSSSSLSPSTSSSAANSLYFWPCLPDGYCLVPLSEVHSQSYGILSPATSYHHPSSSSSFISSSRKHSDSFKAALKAEQMAVGAKESSNTAEKDKKLPPIPPTSNVSPTNEDEPQIFSPPSPNQQNKRAATSGDTNNAEEDRNVRRRASKGAVKKS